MRKRLTNTFNISKKGAILQSDKASHFAKAIKIIQKLLFSHIRYVLGGKRLKVNLLFKKKSGKNGHFVNVKAV